MSDVINQGFQSAAGTVPQSPTITRARFTDTLAAMFGVFLPTIAKGVIIRRPAILALADALGPISGSPKQARYSV